MIGLKGLKTNLEKAWEARNNPGSAKSIQNGPSP